MELRELIKIFKYNVKNILLLGFFGGALGIILYLVVPIKYYATGSFFISRKIETATDKYFNYEGYYSQQTSQNYTGSFIALLESQDVQSHILNLMSMPVNEKTIRALDRDVSVKKISPQVVTLTVRGNTLDEARTKWTMYTATALETARKLNEANDPYLSINRVDENDTPVVKEEFRNIFLNALIGVLVGAVGFYSFIVFKKQYL